MIREKIEQAFEILNELDIDMWLTFVRESHTMPDPAIELIVGQHVTWQTAWILTRSGESIAIAGSLDVASIRDAQNYTRVISYKEGIGAPLRELMTELEPRSIALNYSSDSVMADGLTLGLYRTLCKALADTPYVERFISSEPILSSLRGRKSLAEVELIRAACQHTVEIYDLVGSFLKPGRTEQQVAAFMLEEVERRQLELAWDREHCPAVFTGPEHAGAHYGPTEREVEAGHIVNTDFGVKVGGYCSDLQRTWYVRRAGEAHAPEAVQRGFDVLLSAIDAAHERLRPGAVSWEVDAAARDLIIAAGYPEYPHGLGHQVGRVAHDGGIGLFPRWERYGELPYGLVEVGQVFTIEPRLPVEGHGVVTMEEIYWVGEEETVPLSRRQRELLLV